MAQYQITLDREIVQGIFQQDGGLAKLVKQVLNQILEAQVGEQLQAAPHERTEERQGYAPQAMQRLGNGFDDAIAVLAFPEPYRKRLCTTNIVERLNEEIRRRERVIRIFPNQASVLRLLVALLTEQHEIWSTGYKYFDMTAYWDWRVPRATAAD